MEMPKPKSPERLGACQHRHGYGQSEGMTATPTPERLPLTMLSKNSVIQGAAYASLMSLMGSLAAAASKLLDGKVSAEQIVFFSILSHHPGA